MPIKSDIRGCFTSMIKSSGYIKYFRHQCTTLLQICRDFWALVVNTTEEHQSFHEFVAIANEALQAVADAAGKDGNKETLQQGLNKAIEDLKVYCEKLKETLSGFEDFDPITLMVEARMKDQERGLKIATVEKLKKIPTIKSEVDFFIHDGGDIVNKTRLNLSKKSTSEEVIFKLGRNGTIRLHENAYFYTDSDITWNNNVVNINLGSSTSTYRIKQGIPDFKTYFDTLRRPIHVFVDRNPSIHILLTTEQWTRLFSLAKLITISNKRIAVLKGAGGFLYHAQQVIEQLGSITGTGIFQLDPETSLKTRVSGGLGEYDGLQILVKAHEFICADQKRLSARGWLVEIYPTSATPPENVVEGTKIRRRIIRELPPDSTSSHASAANNAENAATRVKAMVEKIEQGEKEAKNRNKDAEKKRGLFSKVFGR